MREGDEKERYPQWLDTSLLSGFPKGDFQKRRRSSLLFFHLLVSFHSDPDKRRRDDDERSFLIINIIIIIWDIHISHLSAFRLLNKKEKSEIRHWTFYNIIWPSFLIQVDTELDLLHPSHPHHVFLESRFLELHNGEFMKCLTVMNWLISLWPEEVYAHKTLLSPSTYNPPHHLDMCHRCHSCWYLQE